MPWRASTLFDFALLAENILRGFLIYLAVLNFIKFKGFEKKLSLLLILSYFAQELLWAMGTVNWGSAARHHIPSLGVLLVATFLYSSNIQSSYRTRTD